MLVLSRKINERIQIGNDVTVIVTRIAGERVSIGIEAPSIVKVLRAEVVNKPPKTQDASVNQNQELPISPKP